MFKRNAGPFPGKEHPHAPVLAAKRLESTVAEKDLGVLVDTELSMTQQSTLEQGRPAASWAALGRALPAGSGR